MTVMKSTVTLVNIPSCLINFFTFVVVYFPSVDTAPLYCNAELNDCGFKNKGGSFYRVSKSTYGPPRDHTTGLSTGYFFVSTYVSNIASGNIIRYTTNNFTIKEDSNCQIRFYYHITSATKGQSVLQVEILPSNLTDAIVLATISEDMTDWNYYELQINTTLIEAGETFTVQFKTFNVTNAVSIDDISMTSSCYIAEDSGDSDACAAPDFYQCLGPSDEDLPCIKTAYVGDWIVDW